MSDEFDLTVNVKIVVGTGLEIQTIVFSGLTAKEKMVDVMEALAGELELNKHEESIHLTLEGKQTNLKKLTITLILY